MYYYICYVIDFNYPLIPPLYFVWCGLPSLHLLYNGDFFMELCSSPLAYTILPSSAGGNQIDIEAAVTIYSPAYHDDIHLHKGMTQLLKCYLQYYSVPYLIQL